jgi:hypothetical protein
MSGIRIRPHALDCVCPLIARGARTDNAAFATAAGRTDWLQAWLDGKRTTGGAVCPAFLRLSPVPAVAADQASVFAGMCG